MTSAPRRPIFIWLFIVLLIGQWGCSQAPPYHQPPFEEVRATPGTIGVESAASTPETQLKAATNVMLHGEAKGTGYGFVGGMMELLTFGLILSSELGMWAHSVFVRVFLVGLLLCLAALGLYLYFGRMWR